MNNGSGGPSTTQLSGWRWWGQTGASFGNRSLCEILGYPEEELLGKTFQDITHPDDLDVDLDQPAQDAGRGDAHLPDGEALLP